MVKSRSKSSRAGLLWPVGRTISLIRKNGYASRLGRSSVVYTSAVLEYLARAMLDNAAEETLGGNRKRVSARDLMSGIFADDDIQRVFSNVHIVGGGVPSTAKGLRATKKATLVSKKARSSSKKAEAMAKKRAERAERPPKKSAAAAVPAPASAPVPASASVPASAPVSAAAAAS